jgi:dihydroneopterin aldolase
MAIHGSNTLAIITVRGIEAYAYHGVPAEERVVGHRYRLDIEMHVPNCIAIESDEVTDTVDYAAAGQTALEVLTQSSHKTVEHVAGRIADAILRQFPPVQSVTVTLEKPMPPANLIANSVGTRISRSRSADVQ